MDAQTLSEAMGGTLPLSRYQALTPAFNAAMTAAGITTARRAAHWCAQLGHESGGLRWMEEIWGPTAAQRGYEGRADLGNTQPGDGYRYRGRSPIQITGRGHFLTLSKWAHGKGYVPTATYFVDRPDELAGDKHGFLGPVWYWTVARPQLNSLADDDDTEGVTRAINGGTNGIADRRARLARCKALGDRLLPTGTTPGKDTPVTTYYDEDWANRFWEHGSHAKSAVILHTTENPAGTPAANVANYQLTSKTGSYHMLVDTTGHRLRENTDYQKVWACGNHGNNIGLNLSFVAQAAWTRAQWLAQEKMLRAGATVVAYWCDKHNIPKKSITPAQLKAGTRGISDHNGARLAWGVTTHTDVGAGFPWDVFVKYVNEVGKATTPAPKPKEDALSASAEKKIDLILDQLAGPERKNGLPAFTGWFDGKTVVEDIKKIKADVADIKKKMEENR